MLSRIGGRFPLPALALLVSGIAISCMTMAEAEKRLVPLKSTGELRLEDIESQVEESPERALHLIGAYRLVYGTEPEFRLDQLEKDAVEKLQAAQTLAIGEKRWDDAASQARSLAAWGISVESTGMEPDFILADAKEKLSQGNHLGGFLAAVRSHELQPLQFEDALFFLDLAVKVRQRRTAAFFFTAALEGGGPYRRPCANTPREGTPQRI